MVDYPNLIQGTEGYRPVEENVYESEETMAVISGNTAYEFYKGCKWEKFTRENFEKNMKKFIK